MIGGAPGTGKSTVADALGRELSWTVLRSDIRRKQLVGVSPTTHGQTGFAAGIYAPETTALTYAELLGEAREALRLGESVIVDASWTDASWRRAARLVAHTTSSDVVELRCTAPEEIAIDRIRSRTTEDPSDASPAVAHAMRARADPWPEAIVLETSGLFEDALCEALEAVTA
jgi:predicted kinase